jgi:hypothetical protein
LLRDKEASRKDGVDRDLIGDDAGTCSVGGDDEREEQVECSGSLVAGSRPREAMSSTKEGSVVVVVIAR